MSPVAPIDQARVNPEIVADLEEALAQAKEGKITTIAICCVNSDGSSQSWFGGEQIALLITETTLVQHRLTAALNQAIDELEE